MNVKQDKFGRAMVFGLFVVLTGVDLVLPVVRDKVCTLFANTNGMTISGHCTEHAKGGEAHMYPGPNRINKTPSRIYKPKQGEGTWVTYVAVSCKLSNPLQHLTAANLQT